MERPNAGSRSFDVSRRGGRHECFQRLVDRIADKFHRVVPSLLEQRDYRSSRWSERAEYLGGLAAQGRIFAPKQSDGNRDSLLGARPMTGQGHGSTTAEKGVLIAQRALERRNRGVKFRPVVPAQCLCDHMAPELCLVFERLDERRGRGAAGGLMRLKVTTASQRFV